MICKKEKDCDCLKCNVYNYKTKHEYGFVNSELKEIVERYKVLVPGFSMEKFNDALRGNTCMMIEGQIITYHTDVLKALSCGIDNRDQSIFEWD
jgi:hypothetical protein